MSVNLINDLVKKNLIKPPQYVMDGLQYLTLMGSQAYGVANTNDTEEISDWDVYGFCIPHKDVIFPHLRGEIQGFGRQIKRFDQYQQHTIKDQATNKEYDLSIYNIVKYFDLTMNCNPNMIDSLFTPQRCVLYCTSIANLVRENRKLFLSKLVWPRFKGYGFSMVHKLNIKKPSGLKEIKNFENKYNLQPACLKEVENELKKRNLL
jgi:predicted nucleotidyltransferase